MSIGLHIVFLAYRDWAMPILESVRRHPHVASVTLCRSDEEFCGHMWATGLGERVPDLVMYCGWSSEPRKDWLEKVPHVGLHCAESDRYSAGTPLQNQIVDGLKETKHRVFKVGYPELVHREWSHETVMDLRGGIGEVLEQLTVTGKLLYNQFLDEWPNVTWKKWPQVNEENWRPKRTPDDSKIHIQNVQEMGTEALYNFFRCLEDPYPNGCIEDSEGYLYVEKVRWVEKVGYPKK